MAAQETHCIVKFNRMITPTVFELGFEMDKPVDFKSGQFISIIVPGAGPKGRDLRRAYSIASAPEIRPVELCVKLVEDGPGTNYLHKLRAGDTFKGFAPYGDFTYEHKDGAHAMFIATGTGIAPFRSMVLSEVYRKNPPASATLLLGVRTEDELVYTEQMKSIEGLKWVPTVSQPVGQWNGFKGRVTDYLRSLDASFPWKNTEYYLCGNGSMIAEVRSLLADRGVDKDSIHQEKYY